MTTQVIVDEAIGILRAMDGDALLAPRTLDKIVRAVLQAVEDQKMHGQRVHAELCATTTDDKHMGEGY
jgi:hypothetical protein